MSDTLDTVSRPTASLLVNGRNPSADEAITVSDPTILSVGTPNADGSVTVTALTDGLATITVEPGAGDTGFSEGTDDVTVTTTVVVPPTPLAVTLQ